MFKKFKIPIILLVLLALFVGMSVPVIGASHPKALNKVVVTEYKKGDDPWDPGDESDPVNPKKEPNLKNLILDPESSLAKRDDDPWDPGDESPHTRGVRNG